jgi:hypothetical protein
LPQSGHFDYFSPKSSSLLKVVIKHAKLWKRLKDDSLMELRCLIP